MASEKIVPATSSWSRELVKEIAKDIGDAVVAHVEIMYPKAIAATPSTFKLSLRNTIFNEILSAVEVNDAGHVVARIGDRKRARKRIRADYRRLRAASAAEGNGDRED